MFSYAKFLKNGGNFTFIAENVAAIYRALESSALSKDLTLGKHLYATALIDTTAYQLSGQFSKSDIELAALNAMIKHISILPLDQAVYSFYESLTYHQELVCLAMQLEAMIFFADNRITIQQAIDSVISKKDLIESTIHRAVANPAKLDIYETVQANVNAFVTNDAFCEEVLSFDDGRDSKEDKLHTSFLREQDSRIARMKIPNPLHPGNFFQSMDDLEEYSIALHEADARSSRTS